MAKTLEVKKRKAKKKEHPFVSKLKARKRELEERIEQLNKDKTYLDAVMKDLNQMQRLWRS